jgi:very-short-patch-repair endonuclease
MRGKLATPESRCAEIAATQHGVITYLQLLHAGLSKGAVDRRVRNARLHRIHRGVYAVGHAGLSNEGRWKAAVLACGKGAVLSHRSAAELWKLLEPRIGTIHVTVADTGGRRRRRGLAIHRSSSLTDADRTRIDGIALTTSARTIADLRRAGNEADLRRALAQASFKRLDVGEERSEERSRSELERRFLRFCHGNRLELPLVNAALGPYAVDFHWPQAKLVVETDGWRAHRGRQAFEDDRARDVYLRSRGYEVLRFTWRQLEKDPSAVLSLLRRYLRGGAYR